MITSVNAFSLWKKLPSKLPRRGGERFVLPQDSIKFFDSPCPERLAWSVQSYGKMLNLQTKAKKKSLRCITAQPGKVIKRRAVLLYGGACDDSRRTVARSLLVHVRAIASTCTSNCSYMYKQTTNRARSGTKKAFPLYTGKAGSKLSPIVWLSPFVYIIGGCW